MLHILELPVTPSPQLLPRTLFKGRIPLTGTLVAADVYVETANPAGATTIDVHIAGATVFVDQTKRPSVLATLLQGAAGAGSLPVAVTKGQALQIDLDVAPAGGVSGLVVLLTFSDGINERGDVVVVTANLAAGARAELIAPLGRVFILHKITTDFAARVEAYASPAYRTTDAARAVGILPSGEHGVIIDAVTTAGDLAKDASPDAVGASKEAVPTADIPIAVTNMSGAAHVITVTFNRTLLA